MLQLPGMAQSFEQSCLAAVRHLIVAAPSFLRSVPKLSLIGTEFCYGSPLSRFFMERGRQRLLSQMGIQQHE